ncbi:hypothetical protein diail_10837 [Diaporthe ilicicola]|nr:hypothetical protein diail_10837 [Diaporthe ilicicola]
MAQSSTQSVKDAQSVREISPIHVLFRNLYSRVTAPTYQQDISPWNDPDPELQPVSTASLEVLQGHAMYHMKTFLCIHDILNEEIANRRLQSRFTAPDASKSAGQPGEVLFNINDFEPLSTFVGAQEGTSEAVIRHLESEPRDTIAKMGYAWVDGVREAARRPRPDVPRPVSVKAPAPGGMAARIDVEGAENGPILPEDVDGLKEEMESDNSAGNETPVEIFCCITRQRV